MFKTHTKPFQNWITGFNCVKQPANLYKRGFKARLHLCYNQKLSVWHDWNLFFEKKIHFKILSKSRFGNYLKWVKKTNKKKGLETGYRNTFIDFITLIKLWNPILNEFGWRTNILGVNLVSEKFQSRTQTRPIWFETGFKNPGRKMSIFKLKNSYLKPTFGSARIWETFLNCNCNPILPSFQRRNDLALHFFLVPRTMLMPVSIPSFKLS